MTGNNYHCRNWTNESYKIQLQHQKAIPAELGKPSALSKARTRWRWSIVGGQLQNCMFSGPANPAKALFHYPRMNNFSRTKRGLKRCTGNW
ncbi:uncharacterized protein CANTADRAFT_24552 [Suhomyces tanzawaensis NRRL Y-17324]|uniref:Uncharacterized protein n=1 Tax=Suhomyces tanzawaensis NRRL Y-17324 TaxID=984487 RepID=A0A1E4SQE3_9ASCO|nr:uncharacterized protein CANTADRAFT_24552 [Suhomyces tanzawaensis NRRL Y-17324]ODV81715.1 hypothetical protein CANTADRAFT_24552 [Suhomyces tanzawaensis NRRL Y-17324]